MPTNPRANYQIVSQQMKRMKRMDPMRCHPSAKIWLLVSVLKYSPLSTAVPTAIGPLGQRETACHLYEAALRRLGYFEIQMINANQIYKTSI